MTIVFVSTFAGSIYALQLLAHVFWHGQLWSAVQATCASGFRMFERHGVWVFFLLACALQEADDFDWHGSLPFVCPPVLVAAACDVARAPLSLL